MNTLTVIFAANRQRSNEAMLKCSSSSNISSSNDSSPSVLADASLLAGSLTVSDSNYNNISNNANSGSGLTTPLSFLGAFSSTCASPNWFESNSSNVSNSGSSSNSTSGVRHNSVTDALQLLLQGITLPPSTSSPDLV